MYKINYPISVEERKKFENDYAFAFVKTGQSEKLQKLLRTLPKRFHKWTFDLIVVAPLKDLFELSSDLSSIMTPSQIQRLTKILNYDKCQKSFLPKSQPRISSFFMRQSKVLGIRTCYYCNIDFINTINNLDDYAGPLDLVEHADIAELLEIHGMTNKHAKAIVAARPGIPSLESLKLDGKLTENIRNFKTKHPSNFFTLDHVLDKAKHPIAALSLYNLVPCCYGCNSKCKRSSPLMVDLASVNLSPTHESFGFSDKVHFRIFLQSDKPFNIEDLDGINDLDNYLIKMQVDPSSPEYEQFLHVFKLRARYAYHKEEGFSLIKKRKRYSDSQIAEIASILRIPPMEVRKDLFGQELFEKVECEPPFAKLRRDVAKEIGLV